MISREDSFDAWELKKKVFALQVVCGHLKADFRMAMGGKYSENNKTVSECLKCQILAFGVIENIHTFSLP